MKSYPRYKRIFSETINYDKYNEIADYISRNTATRKEAIIKWLISHYNDSEVIDLPPVFGKYVKWNKFASFLLNNKRIPTYAEFKKKKIQSK